MTLNLKYTLPKGAYESYFTALSQGQVMVQVCHQCKKQYFPPRFCCDGPFEFIVGNNRATVQYRTDTPDYAFALMRFDECNNCAIVAIANPDSTEKQGVLVPPPDDNLGLWVRLTEGDGDV